MTRVALPIAAFAQETMACLAGTPMPWDRGDLPPTKPADDVGFQLANAITAAVLPLARQRGAVALVAVPIVAAECIRRLDPPAEWAEWARKTQAGATMMAIFRLHRAWEP